MMAFVVALLVTFAMTGVIAYVGSKRPPGTPVTWGEAMIAAVFVFALLFLTYGVVPHQWLAYADNELQWRKDKNLVGWGHIVTNLHLPFDLTLQTLRDFIVTGIYIVFLGLHVAAWALWQKRGRAKPAAIETSTYGRPLVRQG